MQVRLRCVQQRGNALFFRLAIPSDLRPHFQGRREISQTLDTGDPFTAFAKAESLRALYKAQFDKLRGGDSFPITRIPIISQPELRRPPDSLNLSEIFKELLIAKPCRYIG